MTIWNKLVTALRGAAHEAGEAVTDSQALRILDQEIRDADSDLNKSKEALADIMAKQKLAACKLKQTQERIAEYEGYAVKALDTSDEALALEVAGKVSVLETQRDEEQSQLDAYTQSVEQLRVAIQTAQTHIKRLKQQADTVKATESVQRAQATVAGRYADTDMSWLYFTAVGSFAVGCIFWLYVTLAGPSAVACMCRLYLSLVALV